MAKNMNKNKFRRADKSEAEANLNGKTNNDKRAHAQRKKPQRVWKRVAVTVIPFFAILAALAVLYSNAAGGGPLLTAKGQNLMRGIQPKKVVGSGAVSPAFIRSTGSFSVSLFQHSYQGGANTLVSPISACLALGMTANGASGSTRAAFEAVLGKYGLTVDKLNEAYKAYADDLTQKRGSTILSLSNSIWFDTGFRANKNFLQENADYYGAGAKSLSFNDENSVNIINDWVKSSTGGKISKAIDHFGASAVMELIDALYMKAKWETPFDTEQAPPKNAFYLENGGTVSADYMNLNDTVEFMRGTEESAVALPYDDKRLALLCILPDEGVSLSDCVQTMSENTIPDLLNGAQPEELNVVLPKFTASSGDDLDSALKGMGLANAFSSENADFSMMGEQKDRLYLSAVRQKTVLQVDEHGTQGGSFVNPEISKQSVLMQRIVFNRPFVFAVVDLKTDLPVFLGALQSPQS